MDGKQSRSSAERASEERLDRGLAAVADGARTGAGEMRMRDDWCLLRAADPAPPRISPAEPAVLVLIEHEQRLVTELRKLGTPAGAALHRVIVQHGADDV